jgi:hypothetical protein
MIFVWFSGEFTSFSNSHVLFEIHFCGQAPRSLWFLQKCPWFALRPSGRIGTLQCSPRAPAGSGPAKFRWTGGRDRPGVGGEWPKRSLGSILAEVWSGGGAGRVARRRRPGLSVVPPTPATWSHGSGYGRAASFGGARGGAGVVVRRWEGARNRARRGCVNGDGAPRLWAGGRGPARARRPDSPFIGVAHRTGAMEGPVVHSV